jgi:hypothetical protein
MNKQIHEEVLRIEAKGLQNIELLALVTDSSYEVIFYATYNGKICQSNDLAENGILSLEFVDDIYASVANVVRSDKKFDPSKMNIVKASDEDVTVEYDEKNCRVYALKKKWKESVGIS